MQTLIALLVLGAMTLITAQARAVTIPAATEQLLQSSSYIYVATQRKDGELSSSSPIWFAYDQGKIFFTTSPDSHKAKRIAKGSLLTIHVGTEDGPVIVGKAEKVTDPAVIDRMGEAYDKKYWISWIGFFRPRAERVTEGKTMAYLVEPVEAP